MNRMQVDQTVESLCLKGCLSVREDIKLLQRGVILPELQGLDELSRRAVLQELQSIMAVYGSICPVDRRIAAADEKSDESKETVFALPGL